MYHNQINKKSLLGPLTKFNTKSAILDMFSGHGLISPALKTSLCQYSVIVIAPPIDKMTLSVLLWVCLSLLLLLNLISLNFV